MITPATSDVRLKNEYATYTKVYRIVMAFHYVSLVVLFIYLCKLFADGHSFVPPGFLVFMKEAASIWGIWYLLHVRETGSGLFRRLERWRCSLLNRMRREEAIDILRNGGLYFIDECEMTLENGSLVPKRRGMKIDL